ncbi:MAG: hypothetical protein V6Z82_00520 [Flavobacteriales bacterium]
MQWVELEHLVKNPLSVTEAQTERLGAALVQYPYFTLARILRLRGLRNIDSTRYEGTLAETALYSPNRTFLFDYIAAGVPDRAVAADLKLEKPLPCKPDERYSFDEWLRLGQIHKMNSDERSAPTDPAKGWNFEKTALVIDEFLTDRPDANPVKSPVLSADLMTETLARLYIEQKKYGQALRAYKILGLKYPEKSGYFADQIRSVKKLMAG